MENYTRLEQIGRGSFGTVHKIRRKSDGQIMVWKELDYGRMSDKEKQLVVSEVNILRELRHPYILRYHDRIIDKKSTKLYIIVEYCERGDLRHLIKRAKATRTFVHENRIWKYFAQILSALKTCHRRREKGALKPVLHRDIKPANVFLDRKDNVKLGDFGLARTLESMSKFAYTNVGTPFYMSPEQTNSKKYDERSDIWAVGCMMYELAALRPPFHASNQLALARKINDGRFDRIPKHYSENLYRAIRWMLHTEPTRRPRVEDLENLPEIRKEQKAWSSTEKQRTSIATSVTVEKNLKNTVDSTKEPTKSSSSTATDGLAMKEREAQLKKREVRVAEIEARLKVRESELNKREIRYKLKEEALKVREESISRREMRLTSTSSKNILLTPSVAPPAPSSIAERMMAAPKVTKAGSAEEALEAAKKRLERMAHKDNAPLGDVSNNNKYNRGKGEWSAQAQVDEILRKAKQRTQQYQNKPRV
jgi:NIMA (never in mitosis gene a)-related kinase 2